MGRLLDSSAPDLLWRLSDSGDRKLIDGDVNDFVDRISYGDELIFTFHGRKYFLQGYHDLGGLWTTYRDRWEPPADDYIWVGKCDFHFPVEEFLRQRIWDGRTFWEAQEEMEWGA